MVGTETRVLAVGKVARICTSFQVSGSNLYPKTSKSEI
jgi:hypothetical protein